MLKEKEDLGRAIAEALAANGYSNADAAREFGLKPPSITGWIQTGRIKKGNFEKLRAWCKKTPASHWGLPESKVLPVHELSVLEVKLVAAFRKIQSTEIQHQVLGYVSGMAASEQKNMRNTLPSTNTKKAANGKG
jgi:hypothetical protein